MARSRTPDRLELPVVGPAYKNRTLDLSAQVTKNLFPEINPEARIMVALNHTPGLKTFAVTESADRGMHDFHGFMHVVSGTSLYSIDADGANINLGTVAGDARCVMADDGVQLVIVSGGLAYIYTDRTSCAPCASFIHRKAVSDHLLSSQHGMMEAGSICFPTAGDIQCGAMVDGSPDKG